MSATKIRFFLLLPIPKIEETHHAAEQLAKPVLFQLKVDVFGTAAEDMEFVEEVMRAPFPHLRFHITLVDSHLWSTRITQLLQIGTHVFLARDLTRVSDVGVGRRYFGVGKIHCSMSALRPFNNFRVQRPWFSVGLNTCRCVSMSKKASTAPNTSEMVIEAQTPVSPELPASMKMGGIR